VETCPRSKTDRRQDNTEQLIAMCEINGAFNPPSNTHGFADHNQSPDPIRLHPVDSLDVTIVVDNAIDILLSSDKMTKRAPLVWDWSEKPQLIAEHGYSILLTFQRNGEARSVLYDAGLSQETAIHNLDVLGMDLKDVETMVLSHGHADHHGGLEGMLRRIGRKRLPFIVHPDAWKDRKIVFPTGTEIHMPPPKRKLLEDEDVEILEERGPSLILDGTVLVSGQVERVTSFEKGFPFHQASRDGKWESDPWIWDDQGIICNVKGKGLVVVSSCSHSGVVNILRNAERITGVDKIHAFIGGLHLSGGIFDKIISETIDGLKKIKPDVIVPGHCTGWNAAHQISRVLPEAYVQTSVGTQMLFH
jgi:7,8-dihydropterin-6-yl-methyl-4-(beta-D-ribofuranosyl)aminobenzene 5'-phosphate synthase